MVIRSPAPLVLVADADPYICRVFEAKLTKDGQFRVISVRTAPEAYQAVLSNPFDAILWETRLRDTSQLLPRLRALCPTAILLLMTTDDVLPQQDAIACLDVASVLTKPFGLDTLADTLRSHLSRDPASSPIASIDLCRLGQRLMLSHGSGVCRTRVLERGSDTFVVVGAPRVTEPADFAPGVTVNVEIQGADARYAFESVLLRAIREPVPGWELKMPGTIQRMQ